MKLVPLNVFTKPFCALKGKIHFNSKPIEFRIQILVIKPGDELEERYQNLKSQFSNGRFETKQLLISRQ